LQDAIRFVAAHLLAQIFERVGVQVRGEFIGSQFITAGAPAAASALSRVGARAGNHPPRAR
jgi:hypothetical protein